MAPPDPASLAPARAARLLQLGRHFRGLGRRSDFHALWKLLTMSSADYLDEWFESEALKGTKSASGIIGTLLGPRSPGTAYVLLHHYMGELDGVFRAWGFAQGRQRLGERGDRGGRAARIGAEIRTERAGRAGARRRRPRHAASCSKTATRSRADVVVSGADPRRTFLRLVGEEAPARRIRRSDPALQVPRLVGEGEPRARRAAATSPACPAPGPHLRGAISISPSVDYLERAYDDAKYGEFSRAAVHGHRDPVDDRSVDGAAGQARDVDLRAVRALPPERRLDRRTKREAFGDTVIDTLAEYAPNIKRAILHRQVITPADIERIVGLSEGNIFQGELVAAADVLPAAGAGAGRSYRTPIHGLYPVRLGHASGRRRDGRVRPQRGAGDPRRARLSDVVVIGAGADELVAARAAARGGPSRHEGAPCRWTGLVPRRSPRSDRGVEAARSLAACALMAACSSSSRDMRAQRGERFAA